MHSNQSLLIRLEDPGRVVCSIRSFDGQGYCCTCHRITPHRQLPYEYIEYAIRLDRDCLYCKDTSAKQQLHSKKDKMQINRFLCTAILAALGAASPIEYTHQTGGVTDKRAIEYTHQAGGVTDKRAIEYTHPAGGVTDKRAIEYTHQAGGVTDKRAIEYTHPAGEATD